MPDHDSLCDLSLSAASERVRERKISPVELTEACLARIGRLNPELNAFICVAAELATEQARAAEREIAAGNYRGPLHGIPAAIKDIVDVAGQPTTAASALLLGNIAPADAPVIANLRQAGAVFIGKTNLHEFAYGGSGVISHFGPVRNPANPEYITGGSSSGSAAAVAAGMCFAAIGTDTSGSIRLPAAYCGIVGLKPTYGLVSTDGVVVLSWAYDHVGPMTRTAADARLFLRALLGGAAVNQQTAVVTKGLRIGVVRRFFFDELDSSVAEAMESALKKFELRFGDLKDVEFKIDEDRTVFAAEAYAYHLQYLEKYADKYQPVTLARIKSGERITAPQYILKRQELEAARRRAGEIFRDVDVLVTPTAPVMPGRLRQLQAEPDQLRARELMMLRNTRPFDVLGLPTISVPCGRDENGLPIGLQISGPPYGEEAVLAVAEEFERLGE